MAGPLTPAVGGGESFALPAIVLKRSWPVILDVLVFATVLAVFYGVLTIAHYWLGQATPVSEISSSPASLPRYAFYSVVSMALAYFLSLVFAIGWMQPRLRPTIGGCSRSWLRFSTFCSRFPC